MLGMREAQMSRSSFFPDMVVLLQGIKLVEFEDFMQQGFDKPGEAVPPKPMDLACIQYTSGTTGRMPTQLF